MLFQFGDELPDALGCGIGLFLFDPDGGLGRLAIGEQHGDAAIHHQHGGDQAKEGQGKALGKGKGAFHSITKSARASSDSGISTPMAAAVRWLITSSNTLGRSIGSSSGGVPRRMRSTK